MQERKNRADDDDGKDEVDQPPDRIDHHVRVHAQEHAKIERSNQSLRCGRLDRVGTEIILDDLLQHDGQPERHQDLVRMGPLVEVLDQTTLHRHSDEQHDGHGNNQGQWHRPVDDRLPHLRTEPGFDIGRLHFQWIAQEIGFCLVDDFGA